MELGWEHPSVLFAWGIFEGFVLKGVAYTFPRIWMITALKHPHAEVLAVVTTASWMLMGISNATAGTERGRLAQCRSRSSVVS